MKFRLICGTFVLGRRLALRHGDERRGTVPRSTTSQTPLWPGLGDLMAKVMTKSELVGKIAAETGRSNKEVKGVLESLAKVGYKELKKSGTFLMPGFAKFVVIKKPATKARKGINPFTKEPTVFKAKPARKIVRARPVKAAKDAVA